MSIIAEPQTELIPSEKRWATFSDDRSYRYLLEIQWDASLPACMFIGLNPSTADEVKDDPTIRRIKDYCKRWGYGSLLMGNLFAFRATKPEAMMAAKNPVGEDGSENGNKNDVFLICAARRAKLKVAAWGTGGSFLRRADAVRGILTDLHCFGKTKNGEPIHPLYLRKDSGVRPL